MHELRLMNIKGEVSLYGGCRDVFGYMMLDLRPRTLTRFLGRPLKCWIAIAKVAERNGLDHGWLNDWVKGLPGDP
jgi:hypothetical protein